MNINYQINKNECGLCVIKSFISYFYHKDVNMSELLNKSNLTSNGLSLYDLELIGNKYGLDLDSYQIDIEEFKQLKINTFFILLINNNGLYHYVIAKKTREKIKIYCSEKGEYELSFQELEKVWTSVYIEVHKNNKLKKDFFNLKNSYINWLNLILTNSIQFIILLLTIFNSLFFDQLFDKVLNNNNISNLLSLLIVFSLTIVLKQLGNIFINMFSYKNTFRQYKFLNYKLILKLKNKYLSFYEKVDENFIRNSNEYIFFISSFYNIYLNSFIADTISLFGILITVFIINKIIAIVFITYFFIIIGFELINYFYFKKQINFNQEMNNQYFNWWNLWLFKINKVNHLYQTESLIYKIKNKHQEIEKTFFKNLFFNNGVNFLNFLFQHIFFLLIIILCCEFMINQNLLTFSKILVIVNLFELMITSSKSLIGIVSKFNNLKLSQKIYENLINVDNKPLKVGISELEKINLIIFNQYEMINDTLIYGNSGCGKTTLMYKLNNMIKLDDKDQCYINNININNFNDTFFIKNMIYLNNTNSIVEEKEIIEILNNLKQNNKHKIIEIINKLAIKDFKKCSLGQKQVILFLSLINYKNKIICLDELLSNVDYELKKELLIKIKPLIEENNFLIYISHDQNIRDLFKNKINLYEQKN